MQIKEYTLDVSKWRCGGNGKHRHGKGPTRMLNGDGFMCCLGQFAKQAGVSEDALRYAGVPTTVAMMLGRGYDDNFTASKFEGFYRCTDLADELMGINDDPDTPPAVKINTIKQKLKERGISLKVVNLPDGVEIQE